MVILQLATFVLLAVVLHRTRMVGQHVQGLESRVYDLVQAWNLGHPATTAARLPERTEAASETADTSSPAVQDVEELPRPAPPSIVTVPHPAAPEELRTADLPIATPARAEPVAPASKPARIDLEARFGRRWAALLGGGAVAFGLALLVRHSIQQGWFPPAVRLAGAGLLALVLCAAAEVFRRRSTFAAPADANLVRRAADVPSILLGTGLAGLFAVAYAASAVYGYVGETPAFAAMAAASLAGIAASLAYGPALGILGYLAAQSVPFLVPGDGVIAGAAYVALVGAAGYAAAYRGGWRRLENPAGVILLLCACLLRNESLAVLATVALPASALALGVTALRLRPRASWASARQSWRACLALVLTAVHGLLLATHSVQAEMVVFHQPAAVALGLLVLLAGFAFAATATRARPVAPVLAAAVAAAIAALDLAADAGSFFGGPLVVGLTFRGVTVAFAAVSGAGLAVAAAALRRVSGRSPATALVGAASAAGMLAGGDVALHILGGVDQLALAVLALLQGVGLIAAARPAHGAIPAEREFASAVAASAGVGLAGFALATSGLGDGSLLTLLFALTAAGAAGLAVAWRAPLFASLAGFASLPVIGRAGVRAVETLLIAPPGGTALWPILEDTLLPGLVLAGAVALLRRRVGGATVRDADRRWLALVGMASAAAPAGPAVSLVTAGIAAGGLLLGALVAVVRFVALGDAYAPLSAPADPGFACTVALSGAVAVLHLHRATSLSVFRRVSRGLAVVAAPLLALAVLLNPFVSGAPVGAPPFFNLLLLAYLLPGLLAARLARDVAGPAPDTSAGRTRLLAGGMVVGGLLAYATFAVSQVFQGPVLALAQVTDAELWTHTIVWLVMGVATLAYGLRTGARTLRVTAHGIVALVAAKVAFVDLAQLEGTTRALSVIALGLVLLGIGMAYQRLAKAETQA